MRHRFEPSFSSRKMLLHLADPHARSWASYGAKASVAALPSAANFVFARHPAHEGAALAAALRERAVIVRRFAARHAR